MRVRGFGVFSSNYIGIPELSLPPLNPVLRFLLLEGNFFLSRTYQQWHQLLPHSGHFGKHLTQTVSCEALQHFCRRNVMPSLYIKNQGLCDFANEKLNSLGISLGLMKSFHCNFCCCLCWGLLQLPQHKGRGACGYGTEWRSTMTTRFLLMHTLGRQWHWMADTLDLKKPHYSLLTWISCFHFFLKDGISYHCLTGFVEGQNNDNACKYLVFHVAHKHCLPNARHTRSTKLLEILVGTKCCLHSK